VLERELPGLAVPRPRADLVEEIRDEKPVPMLLLANRKRGWGYWDERSRDWDLRVDVALLGYAYGGVAIDLESTPHELRKFEDGRIVVRRRDRAAEQAAQKRLEAFGLHDFADFGGVAGDAARIAYGFPDGQQDWPGFVYDELPQLELEGWQIEFEDGFRHRVVDGGGEWTAELEDGGGWWFLFDLGIEIEGQRVPLLPVLTALLAQ